MGKVPTMDSRTSMISGGSQVHNGYNNDQIVKKSKDLMEKAVQEFKKINHWRGLYNSYRHLDRLYNHASDFVITSSTNLSSKENKFFK